MVDIEWQVFQWTKGIQRFYGKGPHLLLWASGSRVTRGKIWNDGLHQLVYAHGMETHAVNETARYKGYLVHYSCHVISVVVL